jgi:Lrp/AsnC family leucine-responsive transcriptional regulator
MRKKFTMELDELDRRILEVLQRDAGLTNNDLAATVHASAPTCLRRVRRLREAGLIERRVALVDPAKLGMGVTAIVEITLDVQTVEKQNAFEVLVAKEEAVTQCYRVSPGPDFILMVQLRDLDDYHTFAHRLFTAHANVRNVRTFFSTRRSKFEPFVPVRV